jgi:hypothetical protein
MSYFSKFVWHPLIAALARAKGSSHAGTAAAAGAALDAVGKLGADVSASLQGGLTANSAASVASVAVRDLKDGLKATVDAFLMSAAPVGLNALAVGGANLGLDWIESHAHDYVAALFHHAKTEGQPAN